MDLNPSWEAASCAATQDFPNTLWNPKVNYRVRKSLVLIPILSQINPVHPTPSYFPKIRLNILFPSTSMCFCWSLSFWLSHQNTICIRLRSMRATFPVHLIPLDLIILIIFGEEYKLWKLPITHAVVKVVKEGWIWGFRSSDVWCRIVRLKIHRRFGRIYCLHCYCRKVSQTVSFLLVASLVYSSTLNLEAVRSSETSVWFLTTQYRLVDSALI
jgi:hypothetical protein